jgi:hypothetical protein
MGLYGAIKKDAAADQAYGGASPVTYDLDVVLLYSELDPTLHQAVANSTYGTAGGPTSPINYDAKYFLINGTPYSASTTPIPAGTPGQRVLIRYLNAGLDSHAPSWLGVYQTLVAEDGNAYSYQLKQYSLLLPALQTKDAIVQFPSAGKYAVYDRRLDLTNAKALPAGGLLRFLEVAAPLPGRSVDPTRVPTGPAGLPAPQPVERNSTAELPPPPK